MCIYQFIKREKRKNKKIKDEWAMARVNGLESQKVEKTRTNSKTSLFH